MDVGSSAGAILIKSSHSSGDSSATFSYRFEWDDDWDEAVSLSGSTKAGEWTASSSIDFDVERGAGETGDDAPNIAVTNGVTTIQLGLIAPVSNQAVYGGSTAGGNVAFGRDDSSIGAYIDEYDGLGISHKVSDTISVDVGIQMDNDNQSILGEYGNNLGSTASKQQHLLLVLQQMLVLQLDSRMVVDPQKHKIQTITTLQHPLQLWV